MGTLDVMSPQNARAVQIPAGRTSLTAGVFDVSPDGVETVLDGQSEALTLGDTPAVVFIDAYGKSKGLAPNPRATRLVDAYIPGFANVDMIMGEALVVGFDPITGQRVDLDPDVEQVASRD